MKIIKEIRLASTKTIFGLCIFQETAMPVLTGLSLSVLIRGLMLLLMGGVRLQS